MAQLFQKLGPAKEETVVDNNVDAETVASPKRDQRPNAFMWGHHQ